MMEEIFEIKDTDINVEELMQKIRSNIAKKKKGTVV